MGLHEVAVATRNELTRRGWVQGDWIASDGRVCMFGAYLCGMDVEVNYNTTKAVALTDPGARALARALGFSTVKKLMLWNDAPGRSICDLLTRLDAAIQTTAPAPADPLIGVDGYSLGTSELPVRRGLLARAWRRTRARLRFGRRTRPVPVVRGREGVADPQGDPTGALPASANANHAQHASPGPSPQLHPVS